MALKVELKPGERILIGDCVVTNSGQRARFVIEGKKVPILREKDIITAEQADTPAKRIYLAVLLMYTSHEAREQHAIYFSLVQDLVRAAPSTLFHIEIINNHILTGDMYKALKQVKRLIEYERELLRNDAGRRDLRKSGKQNLQPA
jgi:flagellar biosynthesis repressor protein FlbT